MIRIMKNQISCVLKQALTTFTCKSDAFRQNLEALTSQLEKTTANDVNLHPDFMGEKLWLREEKAPVSYIEIFEDSNLTLGIFILKPGMKLPLHDHPEMHGLVKVISGTIKVTSYSTNTEKTKEVDSRVDKQRARLTDNRHILVEKCPDIYLNQNGKCCVLSPNEKNFHEIESVNGPAAFIDILSPPYKSQIENNGIRQCNYYEIVSEVEAGVYRLQEINSPSWYWTDCHPYSGPKLDL